VRRGGPQLIPRPETWAPGEDNPWHGLVDPAALTVDAVERAMASLMSGRLTPDPLPPMRAPVLSSQRRAAVLAPVYAGSHGEARIVLTRRSGRLNTHQGEVAFPGGRLDPGETAIEAALREAHEEVALHPSAVRVVGALEPLSTVISSSAITPIIGILDGGLPQLVASPIEVDRIFDVSLAELIEPDTFRAEIWERDDAIYPVFFFEVIGDTIWGATGRMVHRLLTVVAAQLRAESG
jgi:8-oxo-dGTP pyrophosphatase MutT (NUDIX family)